MIKKTTHQVFLHWLNINVQTAGFTAARASLRSTKDGAPSVPTSIIYIGISLFANETKHIFTTLLKGDFQLVSPK